MLEHPPPDKALAEIRRPAGGLKELNTIFGEGRWPRHLAGVGIGLVTEQGGSRALVVEPWTENRIGLAMEPIWFEAMIRAKAHLREADREHRLDELRRVMLANLREETGIIRFVVTVLAMLNAAPNVQEIVPPFGGHRFAGMHKVPYLGHRGGSENLNVGAEWKVCARSA